MSEQSEVSEVINEAVNEANFAGKDPKNMSLESLALLLTSERLHKLETDSRKELEDLKKR